MHHSLPRLLAAAGLAAATAIVAAPALSGAAPAPPPQTVTFQEPRPTVAFDDIAPHSKNESTLSLGDRLVISGALETTGHHRLGRFGGTCTAIGAGKSFVTTPLLCQAVYRVAGGQIEATGMMTLSKTNLVIIGGSGIYAGVHGTVTPGRKAAGFDDADKLTFTR